VCDGLTEKCEFCLDVDAACDCIEKVDVVCVRACVCVCLCVCDGFTKNKSFSLMLMPRATVVKWWLLCGASVCV